jgi:hypothetical protein
MERCPKREKCESFKMTGAKPHASNALLNHINYINRQREINIADHSLTIAFHQPSSLWSAITSYFQTVFIDAQSSKSLSTSQI